MSGTGTRLALPIQPLQPTALAHLLHALNQPLTGLQCSLELATSAPQSSEQYVRTLRDGLALTARMRVLVEALRELVHTSEPAEALSELHLDALVVECIDELGPVADARGANFRSRSPRLLPCKPIATASQPFCCKRSERR